MKIPVALSLVALLALSTARAEEKTYGGQHPEMSFVTISSDFWLLLRHGDVTFDEETVSELAGMISAVNWAFENVESDADREQVQSILHGEDAVK